MPHAEKGDLSPTKMRFPKTIAVIGAGPSGLSAIKSCKEEGLNVVCFERSNGVGGLWRYHDDTVEGMASVMKTTVINTQKDMSAFSDFPPPKEFPNYMHNTLMLDYFQSYAQHFDLYEHIRYRQDVVRVSQCPDYDVTGRWLVVVQDWVSGEVTDEVFDGVMVCVGHHVYPNLPVFPGQDTFEGTLIHSHHLKEVSGFKDMNVLVVGIGNSAMDAAVEISSVAKQVYLSTRRGAWVVPRCAVFGFPYDALFNCRLIQFVQGTFGWRFASMLIENLLLNHRFDHQFYGIRPKHRFQGQHPTINDYLPGKIISGTVIIKRNIQEFGPHSVMFDDENAPVPIEAVVMATGYNIRFPFLEQSILQQTGNRLDWYKLTFPPHLKHPSLAVIGMIQPHGSIFPIAESQSRWYALVQTGKVKLPDFDTMTKSIEMRKLAMMDRYVDSPRHTIQVDFLPFMDEIAEEYGAKPNMWKILLCDPFLFLVNFFGPGFPYQYRLQGPHAWEGARKAIMDFPESFTKPLSGGVIFSRYRHLESLRVYGTYLLLFFALVLLVLLLLKMLCEHIYSWFNGF